jgi:hypothetical protein
MCLKLATAMVSDFLEHSIPQEMPSEGVPSQVILGKSICEEHEPTSEEDEDGEPKKKCGDGWWGAGPPLLVRRGAWREPRPFEDGAGLCSPGRWPRKSRRLPELGKTTGPIIAKILMAWADSIKGGTRRLVFSLATGRLKESPIPPGVIREIETEVRKVLDKATPAEKSGEDRKQWVDIRLLQQAAKAMEDPDHKCLRDYARGVRLGWKQRMPRTPSVFIRKTKWRLESIADEEEGYWPNNYSTSMGLRDKLKEHCDKEEGEEMIKTMTLKEAKGRWPDRLQIAAIGSVEQPGKDNRFTHDATHGVLVNYFIKPRDQPKSPIGGDVRRFIREIEEEKEVAFSLLLDVSRAHRRILVDERDWGLQGFTTSEAAPVHDDDEVKVNQVGTYGLASAAYWWARLCALIIRTCHYLMGPVFKSWAMVFADDAKITGVGSDFDIQILVMLAILLMLKVPIKWEKAAGGLEFEWVGYWLDLRRFQAGISVKRADWLQAWIRDTLKSKHLRKQELTEVMGRWSFTANMLDDLKPYLGPLYAWNSALAESNEPRRIPAMIRLLLQFLGDILRETRLAPCKEVSADEGEYFRADARACEIKKDIGLGGWCCKDGQDTKQAKWFSYTLSEKQIPWAFQNGGDPRRAISALELMATWLCVVHFLPDAAEPARAKIRVSGGTDNKGNGHIVDRYMTTAFPMCVVLMVLSRALRVKGYSLNLQWRGREDNEEADDLTNQNYDRFDLANETTIPWDKLDLKMLEEWMTKGRDLYSEVTAEKEERKREVMTKGDRRPPRPRKATKKLRIRKPWYQKYS